MNTLSKNDTEYTKGERIITAALSFITFAIIGGVVRLFVGTVSFSSLSDLLWQFFPTMFGFGCAAAILAFFYPKVFQIIMCFIPVPGSSS